METIHPRGYWLDKQATDTHMFDRELCETIIELTPKKWKVIDIGCGDGSYTKHLKKAGIRCVGYDGSPLTPEITGGLCKVADFSQPQNFGEFDLVLSLEVGEHIPIEFEQIFIDNLCRHTKGEIILSWAIEGQPGVGHVNCRNNDYVIAEMGKRGFELMPGATKHLRINSSLPWFKNTLMYFSYDPS